MIVHNAPDGEQQEAPGRRARRSDKKVRRGWAAVSVIAPAIIALLVSLESAWEFTSHTKGLRLDSDKDFWLRVGTCSMAEILALGLAVRAWATSSAAARYGSYAAVLVQALPPMAMYDDVAAAWRIAAPIALAFCLHQLLGLEAKIHKPAQDGLIAKLVEDRKNRIEALLGIGSRGADAEEIARRRAEDRAVDLATLGKRWWQTNGGYDKKLMKYGDRALNGLHGTDELYAEGRLVDRIDRKKSLQNLPKRKGTYVFRSLRPNGNRIQADAASPDDRSALTSEASEPTAPSHATAAPEPHSNEPQPQPGPARQLQTLAWDLYFDLNRPSQRKFVEAWRKAGHGQTDATVRDLYRTILSKIGDNPHST